MPAYDGRYDPELKMLSDAMKVKLMANAHRGKWENLDLDKAFDLLQGEVKELREAIENGNVVEILMESADLANYALMIADVAIKKALRGKADVISIPEPKRETRPIVTSDLTCFVCGHQGMSEREFIEHVKEIHGGHGEVHSHV